MSDKYEELDEFDFDDFGDGGDGGWNEVGGESEKSRNPALTLAGSTITGIRDHLLDPANQVKFLRQVLPEGYVHTINVADKALTGAKEIYDEAAKEGKQVRTNVKRGVKTFMPVLNPILPKGLADKLDEWSKNEDRPKEQQVDPESAEIAMTMGTIFSKYQEEQRVREEQNAAKSEMREVIGIKQQRGSLMQLTNINNSLGRLVSYQDQVASNVQQKMLELQYRSYFVQRKLLDVTQQHSAQMVAANKQLIHNTGLPDMVKQHNTEKAMDLLKTQTFGRVTDSMSTWFRGVGDRIIGRSKANIRSFFRDLGTSINESVMMGDMAVSSIQTAREMAQMNGPNGERDFMLELGGGQAGSALARYLASKAVGPLRDRIARSQMMGGTSEALMRLSTDAPGLLNEWAGSQTNRQGLMGRLEDFIKSSVGTSNRSDRVMGSSVSDLDRNAVWNHQSQRTLNEVIPGWLSKMHIELKMIRTGDKKGLIAADQQESYNFDTNRFETASETIEGIKKNVYDKGSMEWLAKEIEAALNIIDPRVELGEDARIALRKYLFKLANDRKPFKMGRLVNEDDFPYELMKHKADIIRVTSSTFAVDPNAAKDDDGKWKNPAGPFDFKDVDLQKRLREFSGRFSRIQSSVPEILSQSLKHAKQGQQALMERAGVVKREGTNWNLNNDNLMEQILASGTPTPRPAPGGAPPAGGSPPPGPGPTPPAHADGGLHNNRDRIVYRDAGGMVTGEGSTTSDSINAKLSNREFVMNAESTNLPGVLPLLRYLNRMGRRNKGGGTDLSIDHETGLNRESVIENAIHQFRDDVIKQFEEVTYILADTNHLTERLSKSGLVGINGEGLKEFMKGLMPNMDIDGAKQRAMQQLTLGQQLGANAAEMAGNAIGKGWDWAKGFVGGAGKVVSNTRKGAVGAAKWGWELGKAKWAESEAKMREAAIDIYVKGMEKAKLTAYGITNGLYVDELTGRVINSLEDITGPVRDKAGNIIISAEEFAKGLHRVDYKPVLERVTDRMKSILNTAARPAVAAVNAAKAVKNYLLDALDMPEDVYVSPDLNNPRLTARGFDLGLYIRKGDGTPVTRLSHLTDIIVDKEGKTLITLDELPKLVDKDGKPFRSIKGKIADLTKKALKKGVEAAIKVGKTVKDKLMGVGNTLMGWKDKAAGWWNSSDNGGSEISLVNRQKPVVERLDKIYALLDERMARATGRAPEAVAEEPMVDPSTETIEESSASEPTGSKPNSRQRRETKRPRGVKKRAKEKSRITAEDSNVTDGRVASGNPLDADGDGDVDNSARDQQQRREKAAAGEAEKSRWAKLTESLKGGFGRGKEAGAGFSIMGLLGMIPGVGRLAVGLTKVIGGVVTAGKLLFGLLSKAKNILGPLFGKGSLLRSAAGFVGKNVIGAGLRWAGGAAVTAIGAAAGMGVMPLIAAGAAAYGAYKLYKYATTPDKPISRFRLAQYGFKPDEEDQAAKVAELEAMCVPAVRGKEQGPAELGTGVKLEDALKIFGVDIKDKAELTKWVNWFSYRFKRVFLAHATVLYQLTKKTDVTRADELTTMAQKLVYLKRVHFGNTGADSPYLMMASPFQGDQELSVDSSAVKSAYEDAIDYVKENGDDSVKEEAKKLDKEQDKKGAWGKSWWEGVKDKGSELLAGAGAAAAKAWAGLKDGASRGIDLAKNVGQSIGVGISSAAAGAAAFGSNIYQGVKDAASNVADTARSVASTVVKKGNALVNRAKMMAEMIAQGVTSPVEQAMILAQMHVESGGFTQLEENLNYRAEKLVQMFSAAKKLGIDAVRNIVAQGPAAIGDLIYGHRMGNNQPGDGYRYRGRGFIQLTGKENYARYGQLLGIDLLNNPDLASDPAIAAKIAMSYWRTRVGAAGATGDVNTVTRRINGGTNGLSERTNMFAAYQRDLASGKVSVNAATKPGTPTAPPTTSAAVAAATATQAASSTKPTAAPPPAPSAAPAAPKAVPAAATAPSNSPPPADIMAATLNQKAVTAPVIAEAQRKSEVAKSSESMAEVANILRDQLRTQQGIAQGIVEMGQTMKRIEKLFPGLKAEPPKAQTAANDASLPSTGRPISPKPEPVSMAKA